MNEAANDAGQWVQAGVCYRAYIPAPLPPVLTVDERVLAVLSEADAALRHHAQTLQVATTEAVEQSLWREATASAQIDGAGDARTVANIVAAMHYGVERLQRLPLSLRLLCELHERLLQDLPESGGVFRRHQSWMGPPGSTPATADFVPAPPGKLSELLDNWERYLHAEDDTPELLRLAVLVAQFHHLQPFPQASDRLLRLLINLYLVDRDLLPAPALDISSVWRDGGGTLPAALLQLRAQGQWEGWVRVFLRVLVSAATR